MLLDCHLVLDFCYIYFRLTTSSSLYQVFSFLSYLSGLSFFFYLVTKTKIFFAFTEFGLVLWTVLSLLLVWFWWVKRCFVQINQFSFKLSVTLSHILCKRISRSQSNASSTVYKPSSGVKVGSERLNCPHLIFFTFTNYETRFNFLGTIQFVSLQTNWYTTLAFMESQMCGGLVLDVIYGCYYLLVEKKKLISYILYTSWSYDRQFWYLLVVSLFHLSLKIHSIGL